MRNATTWIGLMGRLLVGGFYLFAGINNFLQLEAKVGYALFKGVPLAHLLVIVASSLLVIGGVSILLGIRPVVGVGAIVLFLLPVTLMMHNFWTVADPQLREAELRGFLSNVALIGSALLLVGLPRPWAWSVDEITAQDKVRTSTQMSQGVAL